MAYAEIDGNDRDLPIAKATNEVIFFEKATILVQHGDIVLGDALAAHRSVRSFARVRTGATVRNYRLQDVVLDADSMMLFKDGKLIPETSYFVPDDLQSSTRVRQDSLLRLLDTGTAIVACNRVHHHYQHWMTQCLPAIDWSIRERSHENVRLILPPLEQWQEDTLMLLGHAAVPRLEIKTGAQYLLPNAEYSQFLNGSTSFNICRSLLATGRRLADAVTSRPSPHRIVYVPCTNPYYGHVRNEDQIVDYLRKRGVHVFSRSSMTTSERINLFREADVVIGPHGEGLTDILFCKPDTVLWELMPGHIQNASYNRLAQAGELDYWGDLFGSDQEDQDWDIDLDVFDDRMTEISKRLAGAGNRSSSDLQAASSLATGVGTAKPLDELMVEFESLGDNCEFGLVQRNLGCNPLGLLRFAGFHLQPEIRLERLVSALEGGFQGVGVPGSINLATEGERREFVVRETSHNLMYHTFIYEGEIDADKLRQSEARRLGFLRRKLFDDLAAGEKIWVWKSNVDVTKQQVLTLLRVLRGFGPNNLLWAVEADAAHPAGTVERLNEHLIRGYIERFAPYDRADDIIDTPWFEVCQKTYDMFRGTKEPDRQPEEPAQPSATSLATTEYSHKRRMAPPPQAAPATESPVLPETSLSKAADKSLDIETSELWSGTSPTMLGQGFSTPRLQQDFGPVSRTMDVRDHLLSRVFLDTACMVLIKDDGHKISETNYLMFPQEYDCATVRHQSVVWLDRSHEYVLGCNRGFTNYFHWTTQALPAIDWSLRNFNSSKIILALPHLGPWQEDMLELLGHGQVPRITLDLTKHYYFQGIHYSDFLYGTTAFGISITANRTYGRLRDAALNADTPPAGEIIYVARSDSPQRAIVNEPDIMEALAREGVRIVVPGEHPVHEQVNLFNRAAVVIGAHGAGLTNVVFCKPGTILYEMMPSFYTNPCYRRLAQAAGLTYYADIFEGEGEGFVHDNPWLCDLPTILNRLRQFRQDT
jgi:capsular polysaccharide biosynthesis protein